MHGILHPLQHLAPRPAARADDDLEVVTLSFLRQAQQTAAARFAGDPRWSRGCHTVQVTAPQGRRSTGCTGAIVAHVSAALVHDWGANATGSRRQRKAHVMGQLQLVLQHLRDQEMHAALTLSSAQCDVYGQDLVQLVEEGLERTTFAALRRRCSIHWEGTLVRSLHPPACVLVLSIGILPSTKSA